MHRIGSELLLGIDTVAIGGVATVPIFPLTKMSPRHDRGYQIHLIRGPIALHVSHIYGRFFYRFQVSLPMLMYGNNFTPLPIADLKLAMAEFECTARRTYPEFDFIDFGELSVTRVDIAFDLPVEATPMLICALRDCYLSERRAPGWVYAGDKTHTFYSKDSRGKKGSQYRSMIGYGKRSIESGAKGLRLETRFHRQYIKRTFGDAVTVQSLHLHGPKLIFEGWKYITGRFCFLQPHTDESLASAIAPASESLRSFLQDFGYLAREVPLQQLREMFQINNKFNTHALKRYNVGFGDASVRELREFAIVREACSKQISISY